MTERATMGLRSLSAWGLETNRCVTGVCLTQLLSVEQKQ